MARKVPNLLGQQFGRLTVVGNLRDDNNRTLWLCACSCGSRTAGIRGDHLKKGETQSCGCLWIEAIKRSNTLAPGLAAMNDLYSHYKLASAKQRQLSFDLSKDEFASLTKQTCYYCGIAPSQTWQPSGVTTPYIFNGVDRLDNGQGYTLSNCVASCKQCNYAKRTISVVEFEQWIERLITYRDKHATKA